jgi:hypothetical protein
VRFPGDVLGSEKTHAEKRLEMLFHQGLQGFFDVHRLGTQFARGIGLELKQLDIGQSFLISHS